MQVELIAIGNELLLGETVDTNSAHIARALREVGLLVRRVSLVGDDEAEIADLIRRAAARSAVVVTTGGLGPTVDDPTREAIARALGRHLEYRPELWDQIVDRFRRFKRKATENNRKQAHVPAGSHIFPNPVGTAPAFSAEHDGGVVVALPGVPREMEHLLASAVLPYLRERFGLTGVIKARVLRTVGIGESQIDARIGELEKLNNPSVGLNAHAGQTDIRLTARAADEAEADALIAPVEAQIRAALGDFIYGEGQVSVEAVVAEMLAARGQTVAVAEMGAGGQLAGRLTDAPDAAAVFRGGLTLAPDHTAALGELAERTRADHAADWGLALALSLEPPTERIQIALAGQGFLEDRDLGYAGPPAYAARWGSTAALNLLRTTLLKNRL